MCRCLPAPGQFMEEQRIAIPRMHHAAPAGHCHSQPVPDSAPHLFMSGHSPGSPCRSGWSPVCPWAPQPSQAALLKCSLLVCMSGAPPSSLKPETVSFRPLHFLYLAPCLLCNNHRDPLSETGPMTQLCAVGSKCRLVSGTP